MAAINLDKLTLDELKQLQKDVGKAIKGFEAKRKKAALAAAEAAAREHGFSLSSRMPQRASQRRPLRRSTSARKIRPSLGAVADVSLLGFSLLSRQARLRATC